MSAKCTPVGTERDKRSHFENRGICRFLGVVAAFVEAHYVAGSHKVNSLLLYAL